MEQIVPKEKLDELMKIRGEVKGMGMKTHADFVIREKGKEGLKRLEGMMAELGHPIKLREVKPNKFYPMWLDVLTLVVMKRLFGWDDKKFQEMGSFEVKLSPFIRLFLKYLLPPERMIETVSRAWNRYHTEGNFKVVKFDKEKRQAILKIDNFPVHPLHCQVVIGVLSTTVPMVAGAKTANCRETKCMHRGDEHHEFLVEW